MRRLLEPLPALAAALLAVGLALLYIDEGFAAALIVVAIVAVLVGGTLVVGRAMFGRSPYVGGLLMESSILLITLGAAIAGAVLVWLAIEKAPGDKATTREKEVFAAISAAVTAYLGSVIIEPEGELWNPVKAAIKDKFAISFQERRTELEKDARDAVQEEEYGAQAPEHAGQQVEGWDWQARRYRTRHLQDQLDA